MITETQSGMDEGADDCLGGQGIESIMAISTWSKIGASLQSSALTPENRS